MELIIHRIIKNRFYTAGYFPQLNIFSLELPDLGNSPNTSCIPEGEYELKKYSSHRFRSKVSEDKKYDLDHYQICDVPNRSNIIIHPGNTLKDTMGCVLPGLNLYLGDHNFNRGKERISVIKSRHGFRLINDFIKKNGIKTIKIMKGNFK